MIALYFLTQVFHYSNEINNKKLYLGSKAEEMRGQDSLYNSNHVEKAFLNVRT